jgi:hypothetical protein
MVFRLPKPLHGWRAFAGEVGIIVLGVFIALAFGQVAEALQWHQQVGTARTAIQREMAFDLALFADRLRIAKCVDRHIADAQQRIGAVAENGETPSSNANLASPGRMILVGDYEAQEAAENLAHFPPAELSALGVFYDQVRFMREWTEKEDAAWNELALLSTGRTKLGAFDVALLRRDLQVAKNYEELTLINSRRQIERGRELGVAPAPSRSDYVGYMCKLAAP